MYSYTIAKEVDDVAFKKTCKAIETSGLNFVKSNLLEDVDGTLIQVYKMDGKEIKVMNDYEIDAMYVDSDISLDNIPLDYILKYTT